MCDRLLTERFNIFSVDKFFTGSKANVSHLFSTPRFELMRHDVTFPVYVEVDQIYNLACPASLVHYQHDSVQTTKSIVQGPINKLGLAKRLGVKTSPFTVVVIRPARFVIWTIWSKGSFATWALSMVLPARLIHYAGTC